MLVVNTKRGSESGAPSRWRGRRVQAMVVGAVALVGATLALIGMAPTASAHEPLHAPGGECLPGSQAPIAPYERFRRGTDAPILVTEDCVDPRYNTPVIDSTTVATTPAGTEYTLIHGRFLDATPGPVPEETPATFAFYFPTEGYEGRFYVGPVHQLRLTGEVAMPAEIDHAAASGAYLMEYSPNQDYALTARDAVGAGSVGVWGNPDSQYRVAAAAAKYSRQLAQQIYGYAHRPYGYYYGGSGGAYMSITAAEHTIGVFDGVLPFVNAHPLGIPGNMTVRMHALRVLRNRNKWPEVMDAIDPGGSGNPYATLNEVEAAALREATLMWFPLRGWFGHATMTSGAFFLVASYIGILDPGYVDDFWTLPGYLGTEASSAGDDVRAARIVHPTTVTAASAPVPPPDYNALGPAYNSYMLSQYVSGPARTVTLASLPPNDPTTTNDDLAAQGALKILTGPGAGKQLVIGIVDYNTNTITFQGGQDPAVANMIQVGDSVEVGNSEFLAQQTHHRHQVPYDADIPGDGGIPGGDIITGYDQFRNPDGTTKYPQRPAPLIGPVGNYNAAGTIPTGHYHTQTKVIVEASVMDIDALPEGGEWYRKMVQADKQAQGQSLEDHFRVWYTDHAQHGGGGGASTRTVSYTSTLQQGLRDLEAWAERGVPPPASSSYDVVDHQVVLKPTAAERHGIQPVVDLKVNGGVRAGVMVGQTVTFTGKIQVPPGTGKVVAAELDFDGDGGSAWTSVAVPSPAQDTVNVSATQTYTTPGTRFPALRGTSQREGDPATPYGRIQNLGRARVVVCDASQPDLDGDGIADACDNCLFAANPGQEDTGGLATSTPDGIGNACQCGDVTGNGIVNGQDASAIKHHSSGSPSPLFAVPGNCDVTGNDQCNGQDANAVKRAALGLSSPLFGQNCHNATGEPLPPGF